MPINAADRLIVALDAPPHNPAAPDRLITTGDALRFVDLFGNAVHFYKIGWPLYMAAQSEGVPILKAFRARKKKIFLDLKFGDIPETVRLLVAVAVQESVDFLTLNAPINSIEAAVAARGNSPLKILVVTLLTSQSQQDLAEMGIKTSVEEFVLARARRSQQIGADGVIASGQEAAAIREQAGKDLLIVTPGIRPAGEGVQDHKRAVTPADAIRAGADYLVVGRPIIQAARPRDAALRILEEMQKALDSLQT